MINNYNPIALTPTDWTTPLEKVYAEQSEQLDRYHRQARERDRQKEEATLDFPEMFAQLAQFSVAAKGAVDKYKANKAEKTETDREQTAYDRAEAGVVDENIDKGVEYLSKSENLKLSEAEWKEKVKELAAKYGWTDKDIAYLNSKHGGKILKEREYAAFEKSKYIFANYTAKLNEDSEFGAKAQKEHDAAGGDPRKERALIRKFAINEFESLNLNKDFVIQNYWPGIVKALDTKKTTSNIKYAKTRLTQRSIEIDNELEVASSQLDKNPSALTFQAQLHIKEGVDPSRNIDIEQSKKNYTNRLYRLGKAGKLKEHELIELRTGQLPIPHAAGKTGEILLKPEQWNHIRQGINEYNTQIVAAAEATAVTIGTNAEAEIITGEGSIDDLIKKKEDTLLYLARTVGTQHKSYKSLDTLDPTLQKPESYAATKEEYKGYYNGSDLGKLLQNKESFKSIPNKRVSQELLGKVKEAENYLASVGLPTTWEKLLTVAKDEILTSPAQQQNLKRDKVFSEETKRIQTELAQKKLQLHLYTKGKYDDPVEAGAQADKVYKEWKDSEGFNVKDIAGNEAIVGRLSPTIEGEYVRAGFLREAKVENNTKPSTYQIGHWSARSQKAINNANGNIEDMLNKPESLIDKEDALGAFIEPSQTGEFQLFYSPELVTKSLAIGKQPGHVLKKTVEALIADPTYKDYVKKFQLKEKLEILENAPDLRLKEIIDKLGDKDLITQYNYRGIMSFTPKQLTRLMNLEIAMNVPIVEK
tara:strand:+ start:785 stop:3058 length:2274 start_codon:yes stop_codon:yes gene_type:complete